MSAEVESNNPSSEQNIVVIESNNKINDHEEKSQIIENNEKARKGDINDPRGLGPYAGDAKLFVANLPFKIRAKELEDLFSKYGSVSDVSINIDKFTGKSRGFAFVTMDDARDAADAVKALHHSQLEGREISVDVAHGGGSDTAVIIRPKVYSHSKKSKFHSRNSYEKDRSDRNSNGDRHVDHRSRSRSRER